MTKQNFLSELSLRAKLFLLIRYGSSVTGCLENLVYSNERKKTVNDIPILAQNLDKIEMSLPIKVDPQLSCANDELRFIAKSVAKLVSNMRLIVRNIRGPIDELNIVSEGIATETQKFSVDSQKQSSIFDQIFGHIQKNSLNTDNAIVFHKMIKGQKDEARRRGVHKRTSQAMSPKSDEPLNHFMEDYSELVNIAATDALKSAATMSKTLENMNDIERNFKI
ncbi:MAG: hypothetical protein HQK53_06870 [Oligoflexia bacterium]|nr:hypothetical protein [Oligoflexia bacterium]